MATGRDEERGAADREAARLIDALVARSEGKDGARLDAALEAELDGYVALTRRIAALDDGPVAPSVRSAVMNEAARVSLGRAEAEGSASPRNGLVALLTWLLRPGPVLAGAALVAVALAISLRAEQQAAVGAVPEMVAMAPAVGAAAAAEAPATPPAGAAGAPVAAAAPAPSPENVAARAAADRAAADLAAAEAAKSMAAQGSGKAAADEAALAAPLADARPKPARPRTTIAASPASLGPVEDRGPPEAPAERAQRQQSDDAAKRLAEVQLRETAPPNELATAPRADDPDAQVAYIAREQRSGGAQVEAEAAAAPSAQARAPAPAPSAKAIAAAPAATRDEARQEAEAGAAPSKVQVTPAQAAASGKGAPSAGAEVERLRKAADAAASTAARVRLLEQLVAAQERAGDDAGAARSRKELASARASLAGESVRAKAAPMKKSAPSAAIDAK